MCTVVKYKRIVIIDPLPDDVFLEIFDLCLRDPTRYLVQRMRKWMILVHVCQRWRRIIFASPLHLDLYLGCSYGTNVRKNLVFWPVGLLLTVDYRQRRDILYGIRLSPDNEDDIAFA